MSTARTFRLLTADALRDGLRNRVGLFAVLFALCVGLFADRCTGFDAGSLMLNGHAFDLRDSARLAGPLIYGVCALLLVLIAGFLASDALARPLSEGTTTIWMARPVSRELYALSRLAGALGLTLVAGVAVLLVVTLLLHLRLGLAMGPALTALAVFAADAWVVSALAMSFALVLPRVVAFAAIVLGLQLVVFANGLHAVATNSGGLLGGVERWGPPLGTGLLYALSPWFSAGASAEEWTNVAVRLAAWGFAGSGLLVVLFRRLDLSA